MGSRTLFCSGSKGNHFTQLAILNRLIERTVDSDTERLSHGLSFRIDHAHQLDLMVPFSRALLALPLINTDGVDPEDPAPEPGTKVSQGLQTIRRYGQGLGANNHGMTWLWFSPDVRKRLVLYTVVQARLPNHARDRALEYEGRKQLEDSE